MPRFQGTLRVKGSPAPADSAEVTGATRPADDSTAVLGALAVWAGAHLVMAPMIVTGPRLVALVVVDLLICCLLVGAALVIDRRSRRATAQEGSTAVAPERTQGSPPGWLPVLLGAAAAGAGVRAAASDLPLVGLDGGIALIAAALLVRRGELVAVAAAAAAPWITAAAVLGVRGQLGGVDLLSSSTTGQLATGQWATGQWAYALAALAGAAAVAFAVHARVDAARAAQAGEGARLRELSVRDPLTGLANRAGLDLVASPMIEHARRSGQALHCLYIDVDGLRQVNDLLGLAAGDDVLRAVSETILACVRGTDVVTRWSGDEFVVFGPGTGMSPLELERRVRSRLVTAPPVPARVWSGRVSIGSATLVPWDSGDLNSLVSKGEQDMELRRQLRRRRPDRVVAASPPPGQAGSPRPRG
jgi:diguanylate cyclase (GGDEF)-like protein